MASSLKAIETLIGYTNEENGYKDCKLWNTVEGRNNATIGMMYLYRCLGVWALHRMVNEAGGVSTVLSASTGRELENMLRAYRLGRSESRKG